jgi:hypothetical protein
MIKYKDKIRGQHGFFLLDNMFFKANREREREKKNVIRTKPHTGSTHAPPHLKENVVIFLTPS